MSYTPLASNFSPRFFPTRTLTSPCFYPHHSAEVLVPRSRMVCTLLHSHRICQKHSLYLIPCSQCFDTFSCFGAQNTTLLIHCIYYPIGSFSAVSWRISPLFLIILMLSVWAQSLPSPLFFPILFFSFPFSFLSFRFPLYIHFLP